MLARTGLKSIAMALALAAMPASVLAQNTTLTNLTASQNFPAYQSTMKYQVNNATGVPTGFGNHARVTATIRYDAATQSYIVRDTGNVAATSAFAPANKVPADSNATFTVYRKVSGGTTETLRLLNPGVGNPLIALTYASYGAWRKSTAGATAASVSDTYFVYGIKTASADVPRVGSANYAAVLDGTFANKTAVYALSGTGNFNANFAAGTISYTAAPIGTPASGPALVFGTVGGSGPISFGGSSFKGEANALNPTYQMDLAGYFYGPAAAEIGATFRLKGGGGSGNGVMVGKK